MMSCRCFNWKRFDVKPIPLSVLPIGKSGAIESGRRSSTFTHELRVIGIDRHATPAEWVHAHIGLDIAKDLSTLSSQRVTGSIVKETGRMFSKLLPIVFFVASATGAFGGAVVGAPTTTTSVKNEASLFLGFAWTFGGNDNRDGSPGVSLKVLSTNERNAPALAAGVTYNFDGSLGCDIGVGYNTTDVTLTFGYDFCRRGAQVGLGGTRKPSTVTTTTTPPVTVSLSQASN